MDWLGNSARAIGDSDCLTSSSRVGLGTNCELGRAWADCGEDVSGNRGVDGVIVVGVGSEEQASSGNEGNELHL